MIPDDDSMTATPAIVPCLWFDDQAKAAAALYASLLPDSAIGATTRYGKAGFEMHGRPEGSVMTVAFRLGGRDFLGLNGGPHFRFNPAISLFVTCASAAEVDALWTALGEGGETLMELGAYDWSARYGWLNDRYGLSWQIARGDRAGAGRGITPTLMFTGAQAGRAEAALNRYVSIFEGSAVEDVLRNGPGEINPEGWVKHAWFSLAGHPFAAMDSAQSHDFAFNEAVSFQVLCASQAEIDRYWEALGRDGDPKAQQCGWLKDAFGVSWQVVPVALTRMLQDPDRKKVERVTNAFLEMKKFDIAALERALGG